MNISNRTRELVDQLLMNGFGQAGDRLEITDSLGRGLGRWGRESLESKIQEAVDEAIIEATTSMIENCQCRSRS